MIKRASVLCASALSLFAFATSAFACGGQNVLYEDDFSQADPGWGTYTDVSIENGTLTLLPAENAQSVLQSQSGFFDGDIDVCVDVSQDVSDPSTSWAALLFGGVDYSNYYVFQVATNGFVNIGRVQKGKWIYPVAWKETQGVINSGDVVNNIRIITKGGQVTGYVNDQQVLQFRAQLPKDGQLVGFYGTRSKGNGSFEFDNLSISEASDEAMPPQGAPPSGGGGDTAPAPAPKPGPGAPGIPKMP